MKPEKHNTQHGTQFCSREKSSTIFPGVRCGQMSWRSFRKTLRRKTFQPNRGGRRRWEEEPEEPEMREEEKQERAATRKKLNHIHQSTGHGSKDALLEALKRRGCHQKVIEEAQKWKCTMREARKRMNPRRFAALESCHRRQKTADRCSHMGQ